MTCESFLKSTHTFHVITNIDFFCIYFFKNLLIEQLELRFKVYFLCSVLKIFYIVILLTS